LSKVAWIAGGLLVLFLIGFIYSIFFKSTAAPDTTGLLVIGLLLGAAIMFLIWRLIGSAKQRVVKEDSHTVVESMRKVFKIVFSEGHFNELYNFEETKKLFGFIPSTKRALVIIHAKVLVGYDFEKCVWETDEAAQKVKLVSFPEPEILSIEPDYKYYNFDENIFNLLSREDLTRIQVNGKKQVELAAIKSHLPKIAADQMRTLLLEVVQSKNWKLENTYKITAGGAAAGNQEIGAGNHS
jgi:xanthosine utilization system XapX-like protein